MAIKVKRVRRISRESAIPAYDMSPWERFVLTETWKTRRFYDAGGLLHFVVPYSVKDTLSESPPAPYRFSDSECGSSITIGSYVDEYDSVRYYLCDLSRREQSIQKVPTIESIAPKSPKKQPPPKTARLRSAIGNKSSTGKRERFPVVQISSNFAYVEDIDEKPPIGFRPPKGAIAKIVTDRGVQYIFPAGTQYQGLGDEVYREVSLDRGSFDVRTLRKSATTPGKVNSRRLVPLGEGKKSFFGRKGIYSSVISSIARAFVRGGGKFNA